MRVMLVGNFGPPHSTENDLLRSLESMGATVVPVQGHDANQLGVLRERAPLCDWILWVHTPGHDYPGKAEAILGAGRPTVAIHLDLYRGLPRAESVMRHPVWRCSRVFTADGSDPDWWERQGIRHEWLPPAVLESSCYLAEPDVVRHGEPIIFVGARPRLDGTGYHPEHQWRRRMIEHVEQRHGPEFKVYEHSSGMRGHKLNVLYASAWVVLGDSCFADRTDYPRYVSDRLFESLGRGAVLVFPSIEGVTDGSLVTPGEHFIPFEAGDLGSLDAALDEALSLGDDERAALRRRAWEHVRDHHTYRHRLEHVVARLRADGLVGKD